MTLLKKSGRKMSIFKCLKVLLILALSSYLMNYVYVAFAKYNKGMLSTNTRIQRMNSFEFPVISFCQDHFYNGSLQEEVFSVTEAVHKMSIDGKLSYVSVNVTPSLTNEINSHLKLVNKDLWEKHSEMFWTSPYYCVSYRPPQHSKTAFQGLGPVLTIKIWSRKKLTALFMFLSHPKLLRTRNLFGTSLYMINSPEDERAKYFIFSLKFKKKINVKNEPKYLNTEAQCSDEIYQERFSITMEECMKNYMNTYFPCYRNAMDTNKSCSNEEEHEMSKFQGIGEAEFAELTGCPFPCTTYMYDANLMNTVNAPKSINNNGSNMVVMVYISEAAMEINEEYTVYDEENLLGDIGGMVGMLMGVSILAMYETGYRWSKKIMRKMLAVTR